MGSPATASSALELATAKDDRSPLQRATAWINAYPAASFLLLTVFYAIAVVVLSSFKLLWLDELITLHIARLNNASEIWRALANGADPNPPITHLLVHYCRSLFGESELALRLPAMVGYWVGLLSLFLFLRRRVSTTWAMAATVMSMAMAAFDYSYESRSYAIFYGLAMLAFLLWTCAVDPSVRPAARRLALVGMALALSAGIATNYFAVVAFLPIALGELTRGVIRTRLRHLPPARFLVTADRRVWSALLLAALPLLAFRSNIQHSITQFAPFAWNKVSMDQVYDSYTQMVEVVLDPLLALFAFAGIVLVLSRFCAHCREELRPRWIGTLASLQATRKEEALPLHETAGVLALMAYPFLGYLIATVKGGMLSPRFVIPVCFGFAIAGTLTARRLFGHLPRAAISLLILALAWFIARESTVGFWYLEQKQCFYKVLATLPDAQYAGEPIVISDPLMVLTFQHYAPASLASRIVFPIDFPAIRLYRRDDSPEENLWAGRDSIYHLPITPLATFQHSAGEYLILASDGNWLVQDLMHHRYPVRRLGINTRAGAIGGFTPLMHGTPVFFTSVGDEFFRTHPSFVLEPLPFKRFANLPDATLAPTEGGPFHEAQHSSAAETSSQP